VRPASLPLRASLAVLAVVTVALAADWLATRRTRTTVYEPPAAISRVELDLASGSADIVGGRGETVRVERTDRFAFGHPAVERRSIVGGVLRLSSRCPRILLGTCSASYRLTVPGDVTVAVSTASGHVHLDGFSGSAQLRSGSGEVAVDAFCGTALSATSGSGDVRVVSACAPERLDVRTGSGDATTIVPPGRYRVAAHAARGRLHVRGVLASDAAPFSLAVQSRTGDVTVAGGL
jgi:hypothetical protein